MDLEYHRIIRMKSVEYPIYKDIGLFFRGMDHYLGRVTFFKRFINPGYLSESLDLFSALQPLKCIKVEFLSDSI